VTIAGAVGYRSNDEGNLKLEIRKQKAESRKQKGKAAGFSFLVSAFSFISNVRLCGEICRYEVESDRREIIPS